MAYWIGYKLFREASEIYVSSFEDFEEAKKYHSRLKKALLPGEIIPPPFLARTKEEAIEEAKKLIPDLIS